MGIWKKSSFGIKVEGPLFDRLKYDIFKKFLPDAPLLEPSRVGGDGNSIKKISVFPHSFIHIYLYSWLSIQMMYIENNFNICNKYPS